MPEVEITWGCNSKALSFHLSTYPLPLFPRFWRREESQAALPLSSQGGHRDGAEGGAGSVSAICPSSCPGGSGLPRSPWQGGLCSARLDPAVAESLPPPLPAVASQACGPLPLSHSAGHPYLSIHRRAGSAGRPSSPPSSPFLRNGQGRPEHRFCRLPADRRAEALCPSPMHRLAFLFRRWAVPRKISP